MWPKRVGSQVAITSSVSSSWGTPGAMGERAVGWWSASQASAREWPSIRSWAACRKRDWDIEINGREKEGRREIERTGAARSSGRELGVADHDGLRIWRRGGGLGGLATVERSTWMKSNGWRVGGGGGSCPDGLGLEKRRVDGARERCARALREIFISPRRADRRPVALSDFDSACVFPQEFHFVPTQTSVTVSGTQLRGPI
jgi:hypothetical protein